MSDKYDVEKLIAKQAETFRMGAKSQAAATIGQLVLDLLRRDGEVSAKSLTAEFEARLAALGPVPRQRDISRMLLEEALAALRPLCPHLQ